MISFNKYLVEGKTTKKLSFDVVKEELKKVSKESGFKVESCVLDGDYIQFELRSSTPTGLNGINIYHTAEHSGEPQLYVNFDFEDDRCYVEVEDIQVVVERMLATKRLIAKLTNMKNRKSFG